MSSISARLKPLLPKQPPHALQHAILLRVIRVILRWDLQQRREGSGVGLDTVSYPLGDLLRVSHISNPIPEHPIQRHPQSHVSLTKLGRGWEVVGVIESMRQNEWNQGDHTC